MMMRIDDWQLRLNDFLLASVEPTPEAFAVKPAPWIVDDVPWFQVTDPGAAWRARCALAPALVWVPCEIVWIKAMPALGSI